LIRGGEVPVSALSFYLGCLAFGGLFVGASLVGGHDAGPGHDGHGPDPDHAGAPPALVPLLSLRFWTFSLAFFGLAGSVLSAVGAVAAPLLPALAGGVGLGAGYTASRLLGALTRRPLGLVAAGESHVGREATLLLPVDRGQRGKIRLTIGGASTDLVAETDADEALPAGTRVLVVGLRGNVAVVERTPDSLPSVPHKETP
jgi:membrane protein implicated in regulation of membrane protease activity